MRLQNGKETTVSLRQLVPIGDIIEQPKPVESKASDPTRVPEQPSPAASEEPRTTQEVAPPPVEAEDLTSQIDNPNQPGVEPRPVEVVVDAQPFIRTRPYKLRSGKR